MKKFIIIGSVLMFSLVLHPVNVWAVSGKTEQLIKQKVPSSALVELEKGRYQDLIIEFENQDIRKEARAQRNAKGLKFTASQMITFKASRYRDRKKRLFDAMGDSELSIIRNYSYLPLAYVRIKNKRALERLSLLRDFKSLHLNTKYELHLTESLPFINQPDSIGCGYGGDDTVVAVLDTGVDYSRPAFGSCLSPGIPSISCQVIAAYEAATDDGELDDDGHGTNVAGIVLGVAPISGIASIDIFQGEQTSNALIIDGINWVLGQKSGDIPNIVAMNLSLGAIEPSECTSGPLRTAFQSARSAGIMSIASSGNAGITDAIDSPACIPEVVSVGAVYDANIGEIEWPACTDSTTAADQVTCFSNSSDDLTLLAPGAQISAAGIIMSGTSMAAPHVSGAVAVLRSAFPTDSMDDTLTRLENMGTLVMDQRNDVETPRLDLQNICNMFDDVKPDYWAEEFIEIFHENGITTGCSQEPLRYCPGDDVTRAQMAVFLERGINGGDYSPPDATGVFDDVPVSYWAANSIEQFYADGITNGCSTNPPRYCPGDPVTRAQMAIFLLRSTHEDGYAPPSAVGIFDDVPVTYWAADWIEQLYNEGITGGCSTNPPRFCPGDPVTRAQMAVFIVRAFDL